MYTATTRMATIYCLCFSDLDECAQDDSLCDQICNNTFGSFVCSCESGYALVNDICEGTCLLTDISHHYHGVGAMIVYHKAESS